MATQTLESVAPVANPFGENITEADLVFTDATQALESVANPFGENITEADLVFTDADRARMLATIRSLPSLAENAA